MPRITPARPPRHPTSPPARSRALTLTAVAFISAAVLIGSAYLALSKLAAGYAGLIALMVLATCGGVLDAGATGG
ncbi:hypothetical protein [Streptosporangium sp. NPDC002721]|uniref:hypothetical protein n=1 Tax=Streptosporangium sp. NPDC002721 TaxID=3366188 RepID=UPI0036812558